MSADFGDRVFVVHLVQREVGEIRDDDEHLWVGFFDHICILFYVLGSCCTLRWGHSGPPSHTTSVGRCSERNVLFYGPCSSHRKPLRFLWLYGLEPL